ncbi:MAG: prolyl oligopeptidase family serine peptidase, partial [Anaerolineae bacterium]|nr:prolyl oligopeptidase family serine peptidase [Anaerolineae bacterium]
AAAILLGAIVYPSWQYAYHFTHLGCAGPRESLQAQGYASDPVIFDTPRGYQLRGWLTQGDRFPEVVIIALPGASGNTWYALPNAAILAGAGYSTLVYEHRSCADPALLHSGGYLEADDLVSAAQYLRTRPDIKHVGVLGLSAGGTAALLAAAKEQDIEAVVAAGGFSSLKEDVLPTQVTYSPIDWIARRLVLAFVGFQVGTAPRNISPVAHIEQISPRPILLIYGEYEANHGEALYAAAGDPKDLWIVPGVGHGGYEVAFPDEYEKRIVSFFQSVFD